MRLSLLSVNNKNMNRYLCISVSISFVTWGPLFLESTYSHKTFRKNNQTQRQTQLIITRMLALGGIRTHVPSFANKFTTNKPTAPSQRCVSFQPASNPYPADLNTSRPNIQFTSLINLSAT